MLLSTENRMRQANHITYTGQKGVSPWRFLGVFLIVFFLFAVILYLIDFVPEPPSDGGSDNGSSSAPLAQGSSTSLTARAQAAEVSSPGVFAIEDPVRIVAPAVGIDTPVVNPTSSDIDVLNNALMSGAVRYPASGLLGGSSRMYIFGHQSHLPVVRNQAFKAFASLQDLKEGDEIIVYSRTATYHYRVSSVRRVTADSGTVSLGGTDRMLTLTTCDSFGTKQDRYEVEAQFISRNRIS